EVGNPSLARGERVESGEQHAAWPSARGAQLGLRIVGERRGACTVSDVERLPQQLSSFGAPIAPADHGAEVGEGARSVDLRVPAPGLVDRRAEQGLAAIAAGDDARRTLGNTERARRAERQRELDLLFCEPSGRLPIAEREMSKRRLRTPREKG